MKMSKLILLLALVTSAYVARAEDDSLPEGSSIKVDKACKGKCFSNVADPNFPDSNTPNIVHGVLDGNQTPDLNDPKAQKDI